MELNPNHNQLPCGISLDTLLGQIADERLALDPAHQAHCSYCQTALHALHKSWSDIQTLARAPVPFPPGLTTQIMGRVRELARCAARNIILATPRGHTQISHHVIAQIARRAALAVPGVLFASAQPEPEQTGPAHIKLAVRLITTYGPALHATAARVQATLSEHVNALTGADIATLDITFADIATPDS